MYTAFLGAARNCGPKSCLTIAKAFETCVPPCAGKCVYVDNDGSETTVLLGATARSCGLKSWLAIAKAFESCAPPCARKSTYVDNGGNETTLLLGAARNCGPKSCLAIAKAFATCVTPCEGNAYVDIAEFNCRSRDDGGSETTLLPPLADILWRVQKERTSFRLYLLRRRELFSLFKWFVRRFRHPGGVGR